MSEEGNAKSSPTGAQKKRKIDNSDDVSHFSAFANFKVHKVLREDAKSKLITLHGIFDTVGDVDGPEEAGGKSNAVVILERMPFEIDSLQQCLQSYKSKETLKNDIYSTHDVVSGGNNADIKATLIFPATEKHISKFADHEPFIIRENPELYKNVTLPCIENSKFSIQWVYNILDKKSESERIVVEDPDPEVGFVMVPDMKWDRKNMDTLYLVAIVHKHGLMSIRDLGKEHLPLLENILNKGQNAILDQYGITPDKLRIYFHYHPFYYHLHVHFTHVKFDAPGSDALRAHLIEDVINNIQMVPDFYQKKTLSYVIRDNDEMYKAYVKHGYI